MKFFHLSDLHFGKQLHGYDLEEEQRRAIRSVLRAAQEERPDVIVAAGDIYDKSVPSGGAMALLEEFFGGVDRLPRGEGGGPVELLVIAGNHDSAPRLRYGSGFLERYHIHIAAFPPMEEGERMRRVTLSDEYGEVHFYLLPYISPGMLRRFGGSDRIRSADDAVRFLLGREEIDWSARNVLVSHQFYCFGAGAPRQCDSEAPRLYAGGLDSVDTSAVEKFDYVALGHIHSPQNLGARHIRYCGTPFPYSVSEAGQEKSLTVVELGQKGQLDVRCIPFEPLRRVRCLRGTAEEVAAMAISGQDDSACSRKDNCISGQDDSACGQKDNCGSGADDGLHPQKDNCCQDYVSITLTDEELPDSPKDYLERYYDHILEVKVDNMRSRRVMEEETADWQEMTPFEAFEAFFADSAGREMTDREREVLQEILMEV